MAEQAELVAGELLFLVYFITISMIMITISTPGYDQYSWLPLTSRTIP
jgi:hypothetical protein